MSKPAYHLLHPARRSTSVVFASPHSGRDYGRAFLRQIALDAHTVRSSEDAFVDRLFAAAPSMGAPLIRAGVPRAVVDLNRGPDELDSALIDGAPRSTHNPRVASGLGVIPRVVAGGRAIYSGKISHAEATGRLAEFWHPYHRALQTELDQAHAMFGQAILIDCHSMPHEAMDTTVRRGAPRPQVVLGDRFGAAAAPEIVDRIEAAFADAGLIVTRNTPFAGAYIAQTYGRPTRGRHAVQVEIDRALYMDERHIAPNANFESLRRLLEGVIARIVEIGQPRRAPERPLAAE